MGRENEVYVETIFMGNVNQFRRVNQFLGGKLFRKNILTREGEGHENQHGPCVFGISDVLRSGVADVGVWVRESREM